ncbi:MAG: endonuclease domain-containing protein [Sulfuricella sp.]|nr:endonuclease domain-containing protein [Sulfuricella sp.]
MPKHPPLQTERARTLRENQSDAEQLLWRSLRSRQLEGCKFRRQHGIGSYIVDFVCIEAGLVVELDGGQHAEQLAYDAVRTEKLAAAGYRVLRFWNNEVLTNLEGVLESLRLELLPSPQPSPQRGEGVRQSGSSLPPPQGREGVDGAGYQTPSPLRGEGWGEGKP